MKRSRGGQIVRQFLETHTQAQLAELLSQRLGKRVRQANVSRYATEQSVPNGIMLIALSQVLGTTVDAWLTPPIVKRRTTKRKPVAQPEDEQETATPISKTG